MIIKECDTNALVKILKRPVSTADQNCIETVCDRLEPNRETVMNRCDAVRIVDICKVSTFLSTGGPVKEFDQTVGITQASE